MTRFHKRSRARFPTCVIAMVAGAALSATSALGAQPEQPRSIAETGFGTVSLPVDLVVGDIWLRARRAWVWRTPEPRGPETIRIILDGDVDTVLGSNRLTARQASIWLRPRGIGGVGDAAGIYEVFAYYEAVDSPGGPAAFGFSADKLPVQALIAATEPVRLSVDLRRQGRPDTRSDAGEFTARSDAAFARALQAIRDPESIRPERVRPEDEPLSPPSWIIDRRRPRPEPDEAAIDRPPPQVTPQEPAPRVAEGPRADPDRRGRPIPFSPGRTPEPADTARPEAARPEPTPSETGPPEAEPRPRVGPITPPPTPAPEQVDAPPPPRPIDDTPAVAADPAPTAEPEPPTTPTGAAAPQRIFSSQGVFFFSAGDRITVERGDDANAVTLTGGVVLQFEGVDRIIEMTARRAVIFLQPGPLADALGSFDVSEVLGVYLEGGVRVSDGKYTMRSPRVYYDVQSDRAMLIDAVFRTYDDRLNMPLYMRAGVIRQEAANQFSAEKAVYANTAFATPHLALGTSRMTITERDRGDDRSSNIVEARHITARAGGVPFFYWPFYKGDPERFPLRAIGFEDSNRTGPVIRTAWDPFSLLGIEPPSGVSGTVDLDYYTDRGPGLGGRLRWNRERMNGNLFAYLLPDDDGRDVLPGGGRIDRDGEVRGLVTLNQRWQFLPEWTVLVNAFYASDEAVIPALFRDIAVESEELTTRAHLRRLVDDSVITLELKGATTDFVPNEHLAQAPGYMVDKLPELGFARIGNDLLEGFAGGALTHTWNADLSRMRFRFAEITPESVGLTNRNRSQRAFGVDPDEPIADLARGSGLDESFVTRFDTRHDLSTKFNAGPVHVTPFVVGRFTAYDTDFEEFSPEESDHMRLWGAAGVTLATSIYRVDDSVDSRTFDLHRIRHIIEPSVTFWHAASTIDRDDLPIYDDDVEGLNEGSAIRVGLNQTWQTKRGAPGRWRTVDVFTLDAEYVWFDNDDDRDAQIGRYYGSRPELGTAKEFVRVAGTWQATEVVGFSGETVWDAESKRQDRNSGGILIRHSEQFMSQFEIRRLEAQDDTYASGRVMGTFGDKYIYIIGGTYNFREDDFQNFSLALRRRTPAGIFGIALNYNNISGETTFGLYLQPTGMSGTGTTGFGGG